VEGNKEVEVKEEFEEKEESRWIEDMKEEPENISKKLRALYNKWIFFMHRTLIVLFFYITFLSTVFCFGTYFYQNCHFLHDFFPVNFL